ncbi:MAG: sulfatase, partial [Candidatus Omnitrophica bacterium]|nr:sulfatase [Candidatus Omnitrophota bacterium]
GTVAVSVAEPRLVPPSGVAPSASFQKGRPNVLLISIDTLRADALSVLGYRRKTSPWMERFFGEEGIRFSHAEAPCTWTLPSHASLFLSQYLSRHGVIADSVRISSESTLLAEHFAREGYDTAAFVDGGFIDASYGFHQGFGFYDQQGGRFAGILPRAKEWLHRRDQGAPCFLFLHTYDVHAPYASPEPYRSRFLEEGIAPPTDKDLIVPEAVVLQTENRAIEEGKPTLDGRYAAYWRALYDGGVSYVDHLLEEFFSDLANSPLLENTVVILLSDHGESFYEHGSWAHSWNVYQELTHVPILIRFPDRRHAGTLSEERVSLLDVAPTLFEVLGWKPPEDWQGRSLLPLVRGETKSEPRRIFCELHREPFIFSAVYLKNAKYIATRKADAMAPAQRHDGREVYDLTTDPGETRNLVAEPARQATEEFARADKALALMRGVREREGDAERADLDSEDVEELERLGYMR